jgi:hypothetical protein
VGQAGAHSEAARAVSMYVLLQSGMSTFVLRKNQIDVNHAPKDTRDLLKELESPKMNGRLCKSSDFMSITPPRKK